MTSKSVAKNTFVTLLQKLKLSKKFALLLCEYTVQLSEKKQEANQYKRYVKFNRIQDAFVKCGLRKLDLCTDFKH